MKGNIVLSFDVPLKSTDVRIARAHSYSHFAARLLIFTVNVAHVNSREIIIGTARLMPSYTLTVLDGSMRCDARSILLQVDMRLCACRIDAHLLFLRLFVAWVAFTIVSGAIPGAMTFIVISLVLRALANSIHEQCNCSAILLLQKYRTHKQIKRSNIACIRQNHHHEFCVQLRLVLL